MSSKSRLGRGRGTGKMKGLSSLHSPGLRDALSLQGLHALFCTVPLPVAPAQDKAARTRSCNSSSEAGELSLRAGSARTHGVVLPPCPPGCRGDTGLNLPFPVPGEPWSHLTACQSHRCLSPGSGHQSCQEGDQPSLGSCVTSQSLWDTPGAEEEPGRLSDPGLKTHGLPRPPTLSS